MILKFNKIKLKLNKINLDLISVKTGYKHLDVVNLMFRSKNHYLL